MAMRGLRQLIRHGDPNKLSAEVRKSLSAFSFGANSFALSPVQSDRTLSCLVDPTDISGLVDNVAISEPSLRFLIDNAGWRWHRGPAKATVSRIILSLT